MNRGEVLNKAISYKELNDKFVDFCANLVTAFPAGNDYGIEIGSGNEVSRDFSIFKHPAKIEFGFENDDSEVMVGKVTFYRIFDRDTKTELAKIYFDNLGNWKNDITASMWPYNFNDQLSYTNSLSVIILDGFFTNQQP